MLHLVHQDHLYQEIGQNILAITLIHTGRMRELRSKPTTIYGRVNKSELIFHKS